MDSIDRISDLPQDIIDRILHFLRLKDAVRTSILSTQWRYKWTRSSKLILNNPFFNSVIKKFGDDNRCIPDEVLILKFTNIVNNILFLQEGPIYNFVLYIPYWLPRKIDINPWIRYLSLKSVRDLTLGNLANDRILPPWMFSCAGFEHLTNLTLVNWIIPSLSTIDVVSFPCVVTLTLHSREAKEVGTLVSKCPLLENLYLKMNDEECLLNIVAPRLENRVVEGVIFGVLLKETERIKTLILICEVKKKWDQSTISCFPLMKQLVLGSDFWSALDMGIFQDCCFEQFKSVRIGMTSSYTLSYGFVLHLIKKIVSLSPLLELITIDFSRTDEEIMNLAKELLRYRHKSTAEIIFNTNMDYFYNHSKSKLPQWSEYVSYFAACNCITQSINMEFGC